MSFAAADFHIRWYEDGQLNVAANCLDRHLATRGDKAAIIWEGDDPQRSDAHHLPSSCTTRSAGSPTCSKAHGVKKGDRVAIYLPMIPEAAVAMLACARIGAIHSVVFGGFSPDALRDRIQDCGAKMLITADEGMRGGRKVPLKANADEALSSPGTETVEHVLVVKRTGTAVDMDRPRDIWYNELVAPEPARVRAGGDGRRGPAVHPLHVRLDRQAEGRAAHHRRLPAVRGDDVTRPCSTTTTTTSSGAPPTSAG